MGEVFFQDTDFELHMGDCIDILNQLPEKSVDLIFADPPYFLSNGGITCKAGKVVSVNKAKWDKSNGFLKDSEFNEQWINACRKILKDNGTIWVSGTMHNIYQIGFALQKLNFNLLNEISWFKPNAPPNLTCKYFAHSHETVLWARKHKSIPHYFNYEEMRKWDDKISPSGKQMRSVWSIPLTPLSEKTAGNHPTQKPIELLKRIIISSSKKGDVVLDPFNGSGTTGIVAKSLCRRYIGIDKEKDFLKLTVNRLKNYLNVAALTTLNISL